MVLDKVHRVMSFTQSDFLKQYIDFCTRNRAACKTPFGKRMFKLFVNAVFGKFIEQIRSYLECRFCTTEEQFRKWVTNPRYQSFKDVCEELAIVFLKPTRLVFNKAYAVGFSILDLSKFFMFQQYYEMIKPKLSCELLFSDTDSLCLAVYSKTRKNNTFKKLKNIMDHSNYPKSHPNYSETRHNALGFWKDEMKGEKIAEYVGLRSKCYALHIRSADKKLYLKSTCKGVRTGYKKTIPFSTYKKCIKEITKHKVVQYNIQSHSHVVHTMKMHKIGFTSFDDKRYLLSCGIHSLPYGSKYIKLCKKRNICLFCK